MISASEKKEEQEHGLEGVICFSQGVLRDRVSITQIHAQSPLHTEENVGNATFPSSLVPQLKRFFY